MNTISGGFEITVRHDFSGLLHVIPQLMKMLGIETPSTASPQAQLEGTAAGAQSVPVVLPVAVDAAPVSAGRAPRKPRAPKEATPITPAPVEPAASAPVAVVAPAQPVIPGFEVDAPAPVAPQAATAGIDPNADVPKEEFSKFQTEVVEFMQKKGQPATDAYVALRMKFSQDKTIAGERDGQGGLNLRSLKAGPFHAFKAQLRELIKTFD